MSRNEDVKKTLQGADNVFHLASYGMSGKDLLLAGQIDQVNIKRSCHVLKVCNNYGVKRLVYTSTYNITVWCCVIMLFELESSICACVSSVTLVTSPGVLFYVMLPMLPLYLCLTLILPKVFFIAVVEHIISKINALVNWVWKGL